MKEVLLERVLNALWESQWTTRWAAENTVCAYQNCSGEAYRDQEQHLETCEFVKLWRDLENVRRRVGDSREPQVVSS